MKKNTISLFLVIIMISVSMLMGCSAEFNFGMNLESYSIDEEKNKEITDVDEISIDVSSAHVNVIPEDRKDIKAHLYGDIKCNFEPELLISMKENTLLIETKKKRSNISIGKSSLQLDVYVPKNYNEALKIDNSSGDISIKDMDLDELFIDLSSGDIEVENLNIDKFEFENSSGDLNGDKINVKSLNFHVSSGKVKFKRFTGNVDGKISSGDIFFQYEKFDNDVDLKASSGDIIIELPQEAEFYLDSQCSSGNIECEFDMKIDDKDKKKKLKGMVVSDKNNIKMRTSSGDIDIKTIK